MSQDGGAGKSWISLTTFTWFMSFLFTAFGFWYGTNRTDSEALTSIRERIRAAEVRIEILERREQQ